MKKGKRIYKNSKRIWPRTLDKDGYLKLPTPRKSGLICKSLGELK